MGDLEQPDGSEPGNPRVALLEVDPELGRYITPDEAPRAMRAVTVPLIALPEGPFSPREMLTAVGRQPFAALVVSGLIAREISVGGQPTLRLLGPGDVLRCDELQLGLLAPQDNYSASLASELAVLDDRFLHAVRHWPRLLTALVERTSEVHDATLVQLAISQQPRVEDRLVALFRALAERWGRVTADGVVVVLSLTHEALGRLIGARRPTVTLALKALAADDRLRRRPDNSWLLLDVDTDLVGEPLAPLTGAARPRLVPGVVPENPALEGTALSPESAALTAQMQWLRHTHDALREHLTELAERNAAARRRARELVAESRARRERRTAA